MARKRRRDAHDSLESDSDGDVGAYLSVDSGAGSDEDNDSDADDITFHSDVRFFFIHLS